MKDQKLQCKVEGDELVIRIGIDTLAFAAAEEFAGEDVWEILDEVDRRYIIEVAKLVMRKEMALSGIV